MKKIIKKFFGNGILNPRLDINDKQKVIKKDKEIFDNNIFDFDYIPDPYIGNKDANIYLLLANPGVSTDNKNDIKFQKNDYCKQVMLNNLYNNSLNNKYPFYYLDNNFLGHGGYKWWNKCFNFLIKTIGISKQKISNSFFCLEFYGYHSISFKINKGILKSDKVEYTKFLLEQAIKDKKIIIVVRSVKKWFELVPGLESYKDCYFLSHNREVEIRNTTLSPVGYKKVLDILSK